MQETNQMAVKLGLGDIPSSHEKSKQLNGSRLPGFTFTKQLVGQFRQLKANTLSKCAIYREHAISGLRD